MPVAGLVQSCALCRCGWQRARTSRVKPATSRRIDARRCGHLGLGAIRGASRERQQTCYRPRCLKRTRVLTYRQRMPKRESRGPSPVTAYPAWQLTCPECNWQQIFATRDAPDVQQCAWCGWSENLQAVRSGAFATVTCKAHGSVTCVFPEENIDVDDFSELFCPHCVREAAVAPSAAAKTPARRTAARRVRKKK